MALSPAAILGHPLSEAAMLNGIRTLLGKIRKPRPPKRPDGTVGGR